MQDVRLIRWFKSAWADAGRSGEWMADAFPRASGLVRWSIRTGPRSDMIATFAFLAIPVLVLLVLLLLLVVLLITALT